MIRTVLSVDVDRIPNKQKMTIKLFLFILLINLVLISANSRCESLSQFVCDALCNKRTLLSDQIATVKKHVTNAWIMTSRAHGVQTR